MSASHLLDQVAESLCLAAVPLAGESQDARRQPRALHLHDQPRVLYPHPQRSDVLVEPGPDGDDFHVFCARHQWAAPAVTRFEDCGVCPACLCEIDTRGRQRYEALQQITLRAFGAK